MNHIATGTAPSLDGELLPLHGSSSVDEDGGGDGSGVDGEAFRGHFPVPAACRNRDSCPPDLGFAMAAALEGFAYRGLFVGVFRSGTLYRRKGSLGGGLVGPHTKAAWPPLWPRQGVVWGPQGFSLAALGCSGSFVQ